MDSKKSNKKIKTVIIIRRRKKTLEAWARQKVSAAISVLRIKEGQRFETSLGYWDELSMGVCVMHRPWEWPAGASQ